MIITSKVKNYDCDLIQVTEITVDFEEKSDYQFEVIFSFLVILFIICNIILIICLLRN